MTTDKQPGQELVSHVVFGALDGTCILRECVYLFATGNFRLYSLKQRCIRDRVTFIPELSLFLPRLLGFID